MVTLRPSATFDHTEMTVLDAMPFGRWYQRSLRSVAVEYSGVIIAVNLLAASSTTCEKIRESQRVHANYSRDEFFSS